MKKKKILVVDDEPKIVEAIVAYLEKNDYEGYTAADGEQAISQNELVKPDLIVLDLMLPKIDGTQVCKTIRKSSRVPIIMLTAKTLEADVIEGLVVGADDYIKKPFSPRELMVRISTILRRCQDAPAFEKMSWNEGDLVLDMNARTIKKNHENINATPNEFKLFCELVARPKKIFTREELIKGAFGIDFDGYDRTVDTHIKNLRGKIETDPSLPKYILTVRGVGYTFGGGE